MRTPSYCRHRASGLAYCTIREESRRRVVYLGPYGSAESKRLYAAVVAAVADGRRVPRLAAVEPASRSLSVAALYVRWMAYCRVYHQSNDPLECREYDNHRLRWRELLATAGDRPAPLLSKADFIAVREAMVEARLCRRVVNRRLSRLRRAFRWAADEGLLPDSVADGIAAVRPLPAHRSAAPERPPVRPADAAAVAATMPHLAPVFVAIVELQLLTGCRPGEARLLRRRHVVGVETSSVGRGAAAAPRIDYGVEHKNGWRQKTKSIPLGEKATALLRPFVSAATTADAFLFPRRDGRPYSVVEVACAIRHACRRAGVARWSPLQLRHLVATVVRRDYGLEAAKAVLGNDTAETTLGYAERDATLVRRVADERG